MKCRWSAEIWWTGWRGSSICNVNLNCCKSWLYKLYTIFGYFWAIFGRKRCDLSRSKVLRPEERSILLWYRSPGGWETDETEELRDQGCEVARPCILQEAWSFKWPSAWSIGYRRQYQLISLTGLAAASGTMLWGPSVWNAVEAPNQRLLRSTLQHFEIFKWNQTEIMWLEELTLW
jgi:hypothetical protein